MDNFILWTLVILVLVLNVKLSEAQGFYTNLDRYKYEEFYDLGTLENHYDMYGWQTDGKPTIYAMGNDNLYYSDWNKSVVYKVDLTVDPVQKTVFAGILNAPGGELSDNGPATSARVQKTYLAVNPVRNEVYIANTFNYTIQTVSTTTGTISHLAGAGCRYRYSYPGMNGKSIVSCSSWLDTSQNGGQATNAYLGWFKGMVVSLDGNSVYTAEDRYVRKINLQTSNIEAAGGTNTYYYDYNDGPFSTAELGEVYWMAVGVKGSTENVYIAEFISKYQYGADGMWQYWTYMQVRRWDTVSDTLQQCMGFDGGYNYMHEPLNFWDGREYDAKDVYLTEIRFMTAFDGNLYVFSDEIYRVNLATEKVKVFQTDREYASVAWLTNGEGFLFRKRNQYYDTATQSWIFEPNKVDLVKVSECPSGSVCDVYSPWTVTPCLPGSIDVGGSTCEFCEVNTFNEAFGNTICTVCPAGRVSGIIGSDTVDNCVNPTPNFVIGYLSIGLLLFIVFQYVVNGRFHRIAFIRKFRGMSLIFFEAKNCSHAIAFLVDKHGIHDELKEKHHGIFRYFKVLLWLVSTTILVGILVLIAYVLVMSKVFFQSLLIYKGFNVDNLGFVEKMEDLAESLSWVGNLFFPFIWVIEQISFFKIDLNTVEVTCKGAQAPMELLINCCVLGFSVIIIESDFHLFANSVFAQINMKFVKAGSNFNLGLDNVKDILMKCIIFYILATSNPLIKVLQFTMSVLQFGVFVEDNGRHATTDSCNDPDSVGYEGLDEALATISTLLAYFILFPTIYTVSKVVIPHGDADLLSAEQLLAIQELDDKKDDYIYNKKEEATDDKVDPYKGKECPQDYQGKLSNNQFQHVVRLFELFDVDDDGRIEEEEMIDHFYQLGLVSSADKTREVFEKADVDHSGSIDFVEFLDFMCRIKTEDRVEFNFLMESTIDKKSCVQLFKDTAKLSTFISPDVIMASTFMWWLNKLFVQLQLRIPEEELKIRSRFSHKDILMCSYKKQTPDEFNEWKQHLTRGLPPYHVLCRLVANGIHGYFCCCDCCGVFSRLLYVVAFFPPVHLCTSIGRSIWYVVGKKYYYYVLACAGIWVDGCVKGYDLDNASKISISEHVDASADQHHAHEDLSDQEIQAKLHRKDHDDFSPLKGKGGMVDRHEMGEVIRMIVAPRAVLLQVIPQLTPLSIYAEIMADSPLFIPSKRAQAFFSDLLIRDALEMSRAKEMSEANHTLRAFERGVEWIVRIRSINVYISESRLFKIVKNLFLFLFSLGVLYSDPAWWISLSMIILFPLLFIGLLDLYVMTGKFVGITDDDVSIFLPSKYSSVLKEVPVGKIDDDSGDRVVAPLSVDPESVDVEIPVVQATTVPTKTNKGMKIDDHLASLASLAKQGIIDQEHYSRAKASLMTDLQRG